MGTGGGSKSRNWHTLLIGACALIYAANIASVRWGYSPFLYCWGRGVAWDVYSAWSGAATVMSIMLFTVFTLKRNYWQAFNAAILVVLVIGLPQFATTIFKFGGSCG